jgi:hypothetical protein
VVVSDITMNKVGAPIFVRLGNRARPFKKDMERPALGSLRNVTISNIEATGANATGCAISGLGEAAIENVTLSNLRLSFEGGGTKADAVREIPEKPEAYPEYSMFGKLPSYGFYCRHVKGLKLLNVQLQSANPDQRHSLVFEDVEDALIDALDAPCPPDAEAMIRLTDVKRIFIRGCRPEQGTEVFLKLAGSRSKDVVLCGNDLSGAAGAVELAPGTPETALSKIANRTR